MNYLLITIATSLLFASSLHTRAENTPFKSLPDTPMSDSEEFFQVVKAEAAVEGHIIKLLVVKTDYLTVSYTKMKVTRHSSRNTRSESTIGMATFWQATK